MAKGIESALVFDGCEFHDGATEIDVYWRLFHKPEKAGGRGPL